MLLSFDQRQINGWAAVAGDYNPIHFDPTVARRAGLEDVVVHGMLPLLHIKQRLTEARRLAHGEAVTLNAKFRSPVLRRCGHRLDVSSRGSRERFTLRRESDGLEVITGSLAVSRHEAAPPPAAVETFRLDPAVCRDKSALFRSVFPGTQPAWLLLDALVFSQFLSNELPFSLVRASGWLPEVGSQAQLMRQALTVQTSHTVTVLPELWNLPIDEFDDRAPIECRLPAPVTTGGDGKSLAGSCQLDVRMDGIPVLQSEIGLFLRFNP